MDQVQFTKQIVDFNKAAFENSFNAMVTFQEQTERMLNTFMEQAGWIPSQGRQAMGEWVETLKKGRGEFKKAVDESFAKFEECLNGSGK